MKVLQNSITPRMLILFAICAVLIMNVMLPAFAKKYLPLITSRSEVKTHEEKHFDRDHDGTLDPFERMNLRTYQQVHYQLVTNHRQRPYDFNADQMLDPAELRQYLADKKSGRLKDVYKKFLTEEKQKKVSR